MKKMLFTAIALLAFTTISSANTKDAKPKKKTIKKETKVIESKPCSTQARENKAFLMSAGYSETRADEISQDIWTACMCSTWNIC